MKLKHIILLVLWVAVSGCRTSAPSAKPTPLPPTPTTADVSVLLRATPTPTVTPDPTGTSLLLTDSAGNEAGHILYDPYGGVLTSTIPVTLTTALAGAPDPATGLAHLGNGRYYDPSMGRPLQPNPAGGLPIVPQSLNRYAATSVGQPGVMEGANQSVIPAILPTVGLSALSASGGNALSGYATKLFGKLLIQANNRVLADAGYQSVQRQL